MIVLTVKEWTRIRRRLKQDYSWKPSIFMIREVMKRELGFTTRYHQHWVNDSDIGPGYQESVCLDFYDDVAETFFRMKYL